MPNVFTAGAKVMELNTMLINVSCFLDDDVYLESEELRQEYVLCDTGIIYRGSANHGERGITETHWEFGQV